MLAPRTSFHPDQFGYYTVGPNYKTYSKFEAMTEMAKTGIHLHWNFNQQSFGAHNWTCDPVDSLTDLYRQRAQQIRDSYDYVVIFYSGGADSWNIVNTFLSNDIKIDEIAHCWSLKGDDSYYSYFNEEIYKVAIPETLKIQQQHPDINHRIIDVTDTINKMYVTGSTGLDFIYYTNSLISPNGLARSYLRESIKEYQQLIDSGKKVAFVWGTEKPRIALRNGRYTCYFQDMFDNTVSSRIQHLAADRGYFDELFYWSPDAAQVIIKQCHIVKKFLDHTEPSHPWLSPKPTDFGKMRHHDRWLTNHGLHSLIYPGWDIATFTNGKNNQSVIGPRDQWFWSQNEYASEGRRKFRMGVEKLFASIDRYWYNNPKDWRIGIKNCINEYPIE